MRVKKYHACYPQYQVLGVALFEVYFIQSVCRVNVLFLLLSSCFAFLSYYGVIFII